MPLYALEPARWPGHTVTWSFAAAGGAVSSSILGTAWEQVIRASLSAWSQAADLSFQQVTDSGSADLRIGFGRFGTTASQIGETDFSYSPDRRTFVPGVQVRIEDPAERPTDGSGTTSVYLQTSTTLAQVATHEIGHGLGLDHSADAGSVMAPTSSSANRVLNGTDLEGIRAIYGTGDVATTDTATGLSARASTTAYSGPVAHLGAQYIYVGAGPVNITTGTPNVFVHGGPGGDAITVTSGDNILDGGEGSNFLTGGTGRDEFYMDGRSGQVTWGTINNFRAGDVATLWGFKAGTSTMSWAEGDGYDGFKGSTIHADIAGSGSVTASVTFAGLASTDTARFAVTTGTVLGNPYLQIINIG